MTDAIPPQLAVMRSLIGTQWSSGPPSPTILAWEEFIATKYPQMADYIRSAERSYFAWCGLTVAYCLAKAGIAPVFGATDTDRFLWARAHLQFGTSVDTPQPGDVMVYDFGGGDSHVTLYNGPSGDTAHYECLGGNQSHQVKTSNYRKDQCIGVRRPPAIEVQPAKPIILDSPTIAKIVAAAASSDLAHWGWNGRGRAPIGYIQGMAVSYAQALQRLAAGDSVSRAMVRIVDSPNEHDVFDQYEDIFTSLGMTFEAPDIDRLRLLWVVLTGLGMRESSGGSDIGADRQAGINRPAEEIEAGAWQQSWNSHGTSLELPKLLDAYRGTQPDAVDAIFKQGVTVLTGSMESFGDGDNRIFQDLAKARPSFAVIAAAIGLRTLCNAWGPINRREAEIVPAADALFRQVQEIVNAQPATQGPAPVTDQTPAPITPAPQTLPAPITKIDFSKFVEFFENNKEEAIKGMARLNALLLAIHPDASVGLPMLPAPPPVAPDVSTPIHQTAAFQLGTIGAVATVVAHYVFALDPNLTILAGAVSIGVAFLGPTGGIVGTIVMNLARAALQASQQAKPK